jgi:hypothetical protein
MSAPTGNIMHLQKRFTFGKFASWAMGGWGLKDWLFPSIFIGLGDGPSLNNIARGALKSSSAIEKVNWFDSHFSNYTEWFVEHYPGFFDSRYRFEMGAKTILSSKYPIKDFPIIDQRTWRTSRLYEVFEAPHPEHTFQYGGPVLLNSQMKRAIRLEQEYHGKDDKYVDVHPLHVCASSHNNVTTVGDLAVYNGIWTGNRDGWKRDTAKPELTASFHDQVWYRNMFVSKNADQQKEHFGENVSEETLEECKKEYLAFAKKFHKEFTYE